MDFKHSFDFENKKIKEFNVVSSFDVIKPLFAKVYVQIAKSDDLVYVSCQLVGYSKDENLESFNKSNIGLEAQTRYESKLSLEDFYDFFTSNEYMLNDSLDTLEYLINSYKEKVLNEVLNLKWEN